MNIAPNIGKSILLAMVIFWTINLTYGFSFNDLSPFLFFSIIPVGLCVTLVIIVTICPFFWALRRKYNDNITIFKNCFPFYTIVVFSLCALGIYNFNSEIMVISFFITTYITTAQSWVWFTKENKL